MRSVWLQRMLGMRAIAALAIVTLGAAQSASAGPTSCLGDFDGDGAVNGSDLGILLASWGGVGAGDLNGNGVIDATDLGILLSAWGPCPVALVGDKYDVPFEGLSTTVNTDAGPQIAPMDGELELVLGPADGNGVRLVDATLFTAVLPDIPTAGSTTGGISLQLIEPSSLGTFDETTGQFNLPLNLKVHYWLIDQMFPPVESDEDAAAPVEPSDVNELWTGHLSGTAYIKGDLLYINGGLKLRVTTPVTNALFGITAGWTYPALLKVFDIIGCPDARRVNKRVVCVQPVFIGTGANDPNKTGSSLAVYKAQSDTIWAKCCVEFEWKDPIFVNNNAYKEIDKYDQAAGRTKRDNLRNEVDKKGENDCIEVFFVKKFVKANGDNHAAGDGTTVGAGAKSAKVIVADSAVDDCTPASTRVLAHELGHAMGVAGHTDNTVMKATGATPNCPGLNPAAVSVTECNAVRGGALMKQKNPKTQCCTAPDV